MAKKAIKPESITVEYDLHDLPTAQHKAGLAGLVLQVESMKARELPPASIPEVTVLSPTTVEATFTEKSTQGLFDDLYDAELARVESSTPWTGKKPVEEKRTVDPKTGKSKKVFVYEVPQPAGRFLRTYTDNGKELWHKLWQDMLWAIPRGRPTTRTPFNSRAEGKPCKEGAVTWRDLKAMAVAKAKGTLRTTTVAGAILLGAQAVSAESVPFQDRVEQALLLHFWQLSAKVFVPERVDQDGNREFIKNSYTLAIPEVADLNTFCRLYKRLLGRLCEKERGYRPRDAVILLPAQGALELMANLARLSSEATSVDEVARALSGVEHFHMIKVGNNIKTASHGRLATRADLLSGYDGLKNAYRNPLFLSATLLALLRGKRWYEEFPDRFATHPWEFFICSGQSGHRTPESMLSFAWDVRRRFVIAEDNQSKQESKTMPQTEDESSETLEAVVYRLIDKYVYRKTLERLGFQDDPNPQRRIRNEEGHETSEYRDARQKVCSDTFLGFRSRRDSDFVSFFTATIGSVSQWLPMSEYLLVTNALMTRDGSPNSQDVKTLAMLALSAASRDRTPQKESSQ